MGTEIAAQGEVDDAGFAIVAGEVGIVDDVVHAQGYELVIKVAARSHKFRLGGNPIEGIFARQVLCRLVVFGLGKRDVAQIATGHDAHGVGAVEGFTVVGGEVLDGKVVLVLVGKAVQVDLGIVVLIEIPILGSLVLGDFAQIAEARFAVGSEEIEVVGVQAAVHDARHHALTGVGLRQADALVDFINAQGFAHKVHLLLHLARQL